MTELEILSKVSYEPIEDLERGNEVQIIRPNEAIEAMGIFSKQECIAFGVWAIKNGYECDPAAKKIDTWRNWVLGSDEVFTTEQLYLQYRIESLK